MATVIIDPGHGGSTTVGHSSPNNARGPMGTLEKNVTLDLARRVVDAFQGSGHTVLLTRDTDVNLGLADRAALARTHGAAAFVSIHMNGDASPTVQGTEVWTHSVATDDSRLLAASVLQQVAAVTGYANRGAKSKGLGVLSLAFHSPATAACLVEVSFLTDPHDETRLLQTVYKNALASAIGTAITDFINRSSSLPPLVNPFPAGDPNGDGDA